MDIQSLKNERRQDREFIEEKEVLVDRLKGKLSGLQAENEKSLQLKADLQAKISLLDPDLESAALEAAKEQLTAVEKDISIQTALIEKTQSAIDKENASLQELQDRIPNINQTIREAIASREAGVARQAASSVVRSLAASMVSGSFETYEKFFMDTFPISDGDLKAMQAGFEAETQGE